MRRIHTALLPLVVFLIIIGELTPRAFAQGNASLRVCNKGAAAVEVVVAYNRLGFQDLNRGSVKGHWEITGTPLQPGRCDDVYNAMGYRDVFVGFGFKNAQGQFISGVVPDLPDWGIVARGWLELAAGKPAQKVLGRSDKAVCMSAGGTTWGTNDDAFPAAGSCKNFAVRLNGKTDSGPFYPVTLALLLDAVPSSCTQGPLPPGEAPICGGGVYYLNITANPASGEVRLTTGTGGGRGRAAGRSSSRGDEQEVEGAVHGGVAQSGGKSGRRR